MAGRKFGASEDEPLTWAMNIDNELVDKSIDFMRRQKAAGAALVIEQGGDEDQAIGALLHDAAEDQGGAKTLEDIRRRFGAVVAEIVSDCTDAWTEPKPDWRPRKVAHLAKLRTKPSRSLLVSFADKTHNAEAILFDYRVLGGRLWQRFNGGAEGTRWYYGALAKMFFGTMPGRLSNRLSRAVATFSD